MLRFAAAAGLLAMAGGCTDSPTLPVQPAAPAHDELNGCVSDGFCVLPPISSGGDGCDPTIAECDDGGWNSCITTAPGTPDAETGYISSCPGGGTGPGGDGGGPGGDGSTPPPPASEPPAPDTCNTGDPVVDDPKISEGLRALWVLSNPDANLAQRRETAGWIVQTQTGFSIVPITTSSASFGCAEFVVQFPTNATVVGFVHTHPYAVGETIIDCDLTSVQDYVGAPSDEDREASRLLGLALGRTDPLPGYIIDKDGYYRFEGSKYTSAPRLPRCGY